VKCIVSDGEFDVENVWDVVVDIVSNNNDAEIPTVTKLINNYPNPFNPKTNIQFGLMETSNVKVDIYNVRGQKIRTLLNQQFDAGYHTISWNGQDDQEKTVASGFYYCRMVTNNGTSFIKMMMLK